MPYGNLIKRINWEKTEYIVTPLNPASDLAENNRVTPVIMAGHGITKGLFTSVPPKERALLPI